MEQLVVVVVTRDPKKKGDKCGEGYPTNFIFLLQEYLYIVWMVGGVAPDPTNHLLSFLIYLSFTTYFFIFLLNI
jgi:hypothetical protein